MFLSSPIYLILIGVELLILIPLVMYIAGKVIKIEGEQFKFTNCIWTIFISGLLSGFVSELHWIAGGIAFLLLVWFIAMKQFKATIPQSIFVAIIVLLVGFGVQYVNAQLPKGEETIEIDMNKILEEAQQEIEAKAAIEWVKYENTKYGLSFDYPKNWEATGETEGIIIQNKKSENVYGSAGDFFITLKIYDKEIGGLDKWFEESIEYSTDEKIKQKLDVINSAAGEGYMTEDDVSEFHMEYLINEKYDTMYHNLEFKKSPSMEGPAYSYTTYYVMPQSQGATKVYAIEGKAPTDELAEDSMDLFADIIETIEFK